MIFMSFRVSMDDPCWKLLPAAWHKYNITQGWRQYASYIIYQDIVRLLGLEEKNHCLYSRSSTGLARSPMFMLPKIANGIVPMASQVLGSGVLSPAGPGAIQVQFQDSSASIWTAKEASIPLGDVI